MTRGAPLLETAALTRRFGGVTAVHEVDFQVGVGELRCLIGPNGAGKTTFFRCLTGQLRPTAGRIRLAGHDITGDGPNVIAQRGVAIKTQVPALFDGLSVAENIRLATWRRGDRTARQHKTEEVLATIGLARQASRPAGELPHGQRQWLELGLVIAGDPQLMLLDEPTAGMTRREVAATAELVRGLAAGRAIIAVEHDIQFIRMVADTVTVFHQGEVLTEGTVDAVLRDREVRDVYLGHGRNTATC